MKAELESVSTINGQTRMSNNPINRKLSDGKMVDLGVTTLINKSLNYRKILS